MLQAWRCLTQYYIIHLVITKLQYTTEVTSFNGCKTLTFTIQAWLIFSTSVVPGGAWAGRVALPWSPALTATCPSYSIELIVFKYEDTNYTFVIYMLGLIVILNLGQRSYNNIHTNIHLFPYPKLETYLSNPTQRLSTRSLSSLV